MYLAIIDVNLQNLLGQRAELIPAWLTTKFYKG